MSAKVQVRGGHFLSLKRDIKIRAYATLTFYLEVFQSRSSATALTTAFTTKERHYERHEVGTKESPG